MPSFQHINTPYANNRVEVSQQPTRQQEYHMRGFSSAQEAQRFLTLHGLTQNLFRLGRHLMQGGQLSNMVHAVVSSLAGNGVRISGVGNPVPLCVQRVNLTKPKKALIRYEIENKNIDSMYKLY